MTEAIPLFRAAQALSAYQSVDGGAVAGLDAAGTKQGATDFSALLDHSLGQAIDAGHVADGQAMQAISGSGDLTEVVAAVSRAELALQTTVAIRDRVLQAYQDIIKMPI